MMMRRKRSRRRIREEIEEEENDAENDDEDYAARMRKRIARNYNGELTLTLPRTCSHITDGKIIRKCSRFQHVR